MKLLALDPCLCETPDRVLGADETLGVLSEVHIQHWQSSVLSMTFPLSSSLRALTRLRSSAGT